MRQIPKSKLVDPPEYHYFESFMLLFLVCLFFVGFASFFIIGSRDTSYEYSFPSDKVEIVQTLLEADSKVKCTTYVRYNLMPTKMVILTRETICK